MNKTMKTEEGANFTAVNLGKMNELEEYSMSLPGSEGEIKGKVFLKDLTNSTGTEISFSTLPPKTECPFFHVHKKNEESYLILSGKGMFQVDDKCFEISEGSIIRVAPAGKRGMINTSDETMVYIVIQSKENSLEEYSIKDGNIVDCQAKWS